MQDEGGDTADPLGIRDVCRHGESANNKGNVRASHGVEGQAGLGGCV